MRDPSIDRVAVGTVRRIAAALDVPLATLIEPDAPFPGDDALSRAARLSAAIRTLMWPAAARAYASPLEAEEPDELAAAPAEEFFADMPPIDARPG